MLNTIYRLTAPRRFEVEFTDESFKDGYAVVRPTYLSICNADQRYYQGKRSAEVLEKKLPMALIHEGIGKVVHSNTDLKPGQTVVMIPNTPVEEDEYIGENYLRSSMFRSSGYDGFMQDCVSMRRDRLVTITDDLEPTVAAFTELISVAYHAVTRFLLISHGRRDRIGIWGDGNLAFIVSLILRYRLPDSKLIVMGKNPDKLSGFSFVDETYHINEVPDNLELDHAFECVGGEGSTKAIEQIIDIIKPEATISIMGVSENPVPVNTRMVLEKGLRIFGSSRSGREDFEGTVGFLESHPEAVSYLSTIVGQVIEVSSVADMNKAFEADIQKSYGKTVMIWNV